MDLDDILLRQLRQQEAAQEARADADITATANKAIADDIAANSTDFASLLSSNDKALIQTAMHIEEAKPQPAPVEDQINSVANLLRAGNLQKPEIESNATTDALFANAINIAAHTQPVDHSNFMKTGHGGVPTDPELKLQKGVFA
ncbi:MAG: hypothetical protein MRY32_00655 [Rickettsiales bacterium]|nr:hypothetical protein [Rickettsiales bacterium]